MTPAELDELERLEKFAEMPTVCRYSYEGQHRVSGDHLVSLCNTFGDEDEHECLGEVRSKKSEEQAQFRAAFLVALRNAAPALLSAARRASMLEERNGKLEEAARWRSTNEPPSNVRHVTVAVNQSGARFTVEGWFDGKEWRQGEFILEGAYAWCAIPQVPSFPFHDRALAPSTKGEG